MQSKDIKQNHKVVDNMFHLQHQMNVNYDNLNKLECPQAFKTMQDQVLAELQSTRHSLSTAIDVSSQTAASSTKGPQTKMDADKRLIGLQQTNGSQTLAVITEWNSKAFIKI